MTLASVESCITDKTVAVMLEPVQGEGGVLPATPAFAKQLRKLCDDKKLLLICDEVQTGWPSRYPVRLPASASSRTS